MTCAEIQERLDDYVDGALPEAAFQEMELHLGSCADCRAHERLLRSLLSQAAALPEERLPSRDLWPQIAVRLDGGPASRPFWSRATSWTALAAAAAVVVALGSLLRHDEGVPGSVPRPGISGQAETVAATDMADVVEEAEREYTRATTELMAVIEARRSSLPAEAQQALARNLQTIDEALQEIRAALAREPGSPQLNHMLASMHRKKLNVLQRVVRLTRA